MNWILASLLMFFSSALMYVTIRKLQLLKVHSTVSGLSMFLIPIPIYLVAGQLFHASFHLSWLQLGLIAGTALFLSWLGNLFSLKSMELAPNPGYSLIISKSYVVVTSIASVFLFSAELTVKSMIAIACIVLFSAVIVLADARKSKHVEGLKWLWFTLGAFFCWAGLALMSKYLLDIGVGVYARLFYSFIFVTFLVGLEWKARKVEFQPTKQVMGLLILVGILGASLNLFMQIGYQNAPNPGYINAVNGSSILLVTLLSALLYKDELNWKKFVGMIGVFAGLVLLFIK